jgi:hypothetical protein
MSSIRKGNGIKYFENFDFQNLFKGGTELALKEREDFFYKKRHLKSDFIVKASYYNFPFFMKIDEPVLFHPLSNEEEFFSIIKKIEDDLNIKITFGVFIKSGNRCLISHNHIGYNYKFDRNLYTLKYVLDYKGKQSIFFCNKDYIRISEKNKDSWYSFKTYRPHMYCSNDHKKTNTFRYELALNYYKKDFFESNKEQFKKLMKGSFFPKTNFDKDVAFEIGIKLLPSFFIFKKNKKRVCL